MAIDTTSPRTRRAILGGAVGAVAASVFGAVARPLPADAQADGIYGLNDQNAADVIRGRSVTQNGFPNSGKGVGVLGYSDLYIGVYGGSAAGRGVLGQSTNGAGVYKSGRLWYCRTGGNPGTWKLLA